MLVVQGESYKGDQIAKQEETSPVAEHRILLQILFNLSVSVDENARYHGTNASKKVYGFD